jgi:hypothetical protein
VRNLDAWYKAFDVQPGQKLWTHEWVTARQKQLRELLMKRYARYTRAQLLALPDPGERTLAHKPAVPA